jgi:hypothetical protein
MIEWLVALAALALLGGAGSAVRGLAGIPRDRALLESVKCLFLGLTAGGLLAPLAAWADANVVATTAAGLAGLTAIGWMRGRGAPAPPDPRAPGPGVLLLAIPLALACVLGLDRRFAFGDEVSVWGYKAAVLVETGRLVPTEWSQWTSRGPSYPVSLPVAGALASLPWPELSVKACRAVALAGAGTFLIATFDLLGWVAAGPTRLLAALAVGCLPAVLGESFLFMADLWLAAGVAFAASALLASRLDTLRNDTGRRNEALLFVAALPLVKIDGAPLAALMAAAGACLLPAGTRLRWLLTAALAAAAAAAPWWSWCVRCGVDPASGRVLGDAAGPSPVVQILTDPLALGGRFGAAAVAVLDTLLISGALPRQVGDAVPFLALPLLLAALIAGGGFASTHRRAAALLAVAILLGQCLPFALAANFAWQLDMAKLRAGLHVLPGLLLVAATLRRLDPPSALP